MIEIMIVIVVIGILAAVAFPSYRIQMLKMKNPEGIRILMFVWEAQKEYSRENGVYASNMADLAIDNIPTPKYFLNPSLNTTSTQTCNSSPQLYIVKMHSRNDGYRLYALKDGRVVCVYPGVGCTASLCTKMGFPTDW